MRPLLGLWVDDPPREALREVFWARLERLGFSTAAIMVDSSAKGFDPRWTPQQVWQACELALVRDLEVVLTCWPEPSRQELDRLFDYAASALSGGAAGLEVDVEGQWTPRYLSGFRDIDEASHYLIDGLEEVCSPLDVRRELTTHCGHREGGVGARLTPKMDRVNLQCYSVRRRGDREVAWGSPDAPGNLQRRGLERLFRIPEVANGEVLVGAGLAMWSQDWPGVPPSEAMRVARDAAEEYPLAEVRYWSSKFSQRRYVPAGLRAG